MKTLAIIAVLLFAIATALILLLPEKGEVTERPSIVQSEERTARAAEKEPEQQAPSEGLSEQGGNDVVDLERERLEAIRAEWITESYAKNVVLTQRKSESIKGFKFEWLDRSFLPEDAFQHIMGQLPVPSSGEPSSDDDDEGQRVEPLTKEAAAKGLGRRMSWAYPPIKGMEVDGYFLFSGGTTQWAIYDFSSGVAVDAKTGKIHQWTSKEALQRLEELRILNEQEHREWREERNRQAEEKRRLEREKRRNAQ